MTIKDKKDNKHIFIKLLVVSTVTLILAIILTYVGMHFADLSGHASKGSMSEFFYAIGTLVIGLFCFVSYAGAAGTFGFTLFIWFTPELEEMK